MLQCWEEDPDTRPTFKDMVDILTDMASQDKVCKNYFVMQLSQ